MRVLCVCVCVCVCVSVRVCVWLWGRECVCAHLFGRAACVQALDRVLPSCPLLPFSPTFLSLLLPSSCPPSHVLLSPPLTSTPHPRLPYSENVLEERYVYLYIQCNALAASNAAELSHLRARTCTHTIPHSPAQPRTSALSIMRRQTLQPTHARFCACCPVEGCVCTRTHAHTHSHLMHAHTHKHSSAGTGHRECVCCLLVLLQ